MSAQASTPLSVSSLVLLAQQRELEALCALADRAELVDVMGQLIHALQRERGASSLYLASRGQRCADTRREAAAAARPIEQALRSLFARHVGPGQPAPARTLTLIAWVLLGLDAMEGLREQVERRALAAHEVVKAYSRLIAGLVELLFQLADAAAHPAVSRPLVALLHLVQGKEAAGQERAVGAELFAGGVCHEAQQQRIVHLIEAQERSLRVFGEFAEPALRLRWEQQQLAPVVAVHERLRRTLCAARADAVLDSNLSDLWFQACSERITLLWEVQVEQVQALREAVARQIAAAQRELADVQGLLRRLREHLPAHSHAVERFLDTDKPLGAAPALVPGPGSAPALADPAPLVDLLQAQSARLASMEAQLEAAHRALHERKVIERAKGVLMSRLGLSEEAAYRALQKTAMDQNRRLLEVAEAMLALPELAFARPGAP